MQEVIAGTKAVRTYYPQSDVIIELGGEDAKITYLTGGNEHRMNGNCAGGTGAFIDQMATLLDTDASGLNELAKKADTIYPIAARCGVFAKTDIQALLNEGASKEMSPLPSSSPSSSRPSPAWPAAVPSKARSASSAVR